MIKALDTRLTKVRSTSTELERVGAFYSRIIELCVGNPPKDNRHLRALEEQVRIDRCLKAGWHTFPCFVMQSSQGFELQYPVPCPGVRHSLLQYS